MGYWLLAGVFGVITLLVGCAFWFEPPQRKTNSDLFAAIALLFAYGIPALIAVVFGLRSEIIADENGLCWRRVRRWKTVAWADVSDFYYPRESRKQAFFKVETPVGEFSFSEGANSHALALAELIVQRASNAKAREWGVRGLRDVDVEPQVFRYGNAENWFFGGLYPFFFGVPVFAPLYLLLSGNQSFREGWQIPFRTLLFCGIFFFLAWLSFLAAFIFFVNWGRENWQRRHETLEVSPQGIVWKNGAVSLPVRWDEIHEFHVEGRSLQHRLYWVETAQGGIQFSGAISNVGLLLKSMQKYAPRLGIERARRAEEKLRATDSQWSGGRPGLGSKTFHYRTRSNRAQAWFPTALCLVIPLVMLTIPPDEQLATPPATAALTCFLIALPPTLWAWFAYYRSALVVSDEGLEQVGLWRKKFIAWPQVQELKVRDDGARCIIGKDVQIVLHSGLCLPIDWEELKDEITRRSINVESSEWREI